MADSPYTITYFYAGNGPILPVTNSSQMLTVNPAPLTVTASNESMTYGGTVPTLAYTYTGLVNGDSSDSFSGGLATSATSSSSVGSYAITQGSLAATGNYTIGAFTPGTVTVNAAPLTVTASNESMTYGGTVPTLAYTYTGLVNGDSSASFSGGLATSATSSSSVGSYAITQGSLAATGNYTIGAFNAVTLTVDAASLIVTASNESMTYGGTVPTLAYTYTGLVNGDASTTFSGVLATSATSSSSVGGYAITQGTLAATGNYTIGTFNAGTLTVDAASLVVTATNESMTYGGTVPALGYTYSGLVNGDTNATLTGGLATSATSSSNVGGYAITQGTLAATGNYTIGTSNAGTLTVDAASLVVTATNESMTYGGSVPALGYTYSGLVNGDSSATFTGGLATSATSSSNVGSYAINQGTLAATGNYTIGTFNADTLTVDAASLIVTATNESMTYGGSVPVLGYTYSGLVNGDTSAVFTGGLATSATSSSNVGAYAITEGTLAATGNYTIGAFNAGTLTVDAASLIVTATNESMTYGGSVPVLGYTYSGLVNGDTSAVFTGGLATSATSSSNVGAYAITEGTLAATVNYTIGAFNAGVLTVNPASLTVTASNESTTYGGAVPALAYTYTGLVNGNTSATITGGLTTTATSSSNVGGYAINQGTLAATGNYTIGTFNAGTLTVSPAPLTITASNESMTYDGAVPALAYTYTGLVNGNASATFTGGLATSATSSSNVGAYAITEGTLTATGNYTIGAFNAGTVTVNPASLVVTATNESMTYGGSVPALAYTYTGLVNGNTSATFTGGLATTGTSTSGVGSYPITQGTLAAAGNYKIVAFSPGTLTVSPAPLTVTASNESMTYDGAVPALAYAYTGLVNGNTSATFTGGLATTATSTSGVGSYPITQGTLAATGNYKIGAFNSGTLTITMATNGLVIILNPTASGALSLTGSASINVPGVVYVDSSSSSALSATGAPSIKASAIDVVGGVDKSGSPSFSPSPITGVATLADPLSGLALPSTSGLTSYGSEILGGNSSATIEPGIYSQITASGSAKLTLSPGIYIIEGGGFSVSGAASVSGSGVTIFNVGSKYPTTGGTYGSISLSGSGTCSLSPATSGTYAGILFFQPKDNTSIISVSGAASSLTGAIYAPAAELTVSGSGELSAAIDVATMSVTGSGVADAEPLLAPSVTGQTATTQVQSTSGAPANGSSPSTSLMALDFVLADASTTATRTASRLTATAARRQVALAAAKPSPVKVVTTSRPLVIEPAALDEFSLRELLS